MLLVLGFETTTFLLRSTSNKLNQPRGIRISLIKHLAPKLVATNLNCLTKKFQLTFRLSLKDTNPRRLGEKREPFLCATSSQFWPSQIFNPFDFLDL